MTTEEYIHDIIEQRLVLHMERFNELHHDAYEDTRAAIKARSTFDLEMMKLPHEQSEVIEDCVNAMIILAEKDTEHFYRAGVKDGIAMHKWVKRMSKAGLQ